MQSTWLTVIIPSYNHAQFITESIESVVNQTFTDFQLLVIDDGSTDNSPELIKQLQKKYGFEFIEQTNHGLTKTLNKAVNLVESEYICVFSSDDVLSTTYLEEQVRELKKNPEISILSGTDKQYDENSKKSLNFYSFEDIFIKRKYNMLAPGMILKREVLISVGGYDENIRLEDFYILTTFAQKGYQLAENKNAYVFYRKHENNNYKKHKFMVYEMKKIVDQFSYINDYPKIKRMWYLNLFCKLCKYNPREAFKFFTYVKYYFLHKKFWHGVKRLLFGSSSS